MDRTSNSTHRPALATTPTNSTTPVTPPLSNTGTVAMSIADLQRCSVPPLHDNPHVDYARADDKTRGWLYNGTRPKSDAEVKAIAVFCVKQKLPDALSWLVLQCGLDKLDFRGQKLGDQDAQMIASWLERCPRPIALDLASNDIGYEFATALAGVLKNHATLTSLDVSRNIFGYAGATVLADALATNSSLTSLKVNDNRISGTVATAFANALKTNSTLTSLDVSVNKFGNSGAAVLADALQINSTLTSLRASYNDIGATGATAIADALASNSTLTSLDSEWNNIGATGATAIAKALEANSTLTSLNVGHNDIGDTGATAFADLLKINSTLASLNISLNNIGVFGTTALAKVLKANSTLTALDASYSDIDATGSLAFADSLETNTMLTALELQGRSRNAIDKSAMDFVAHRINANKRSNPLTDPAVESLVMLASAQDSYFPSEVGKLIVQNMITLGPDQGDGAQGLESLVVASSIVQKRELAIEAFQTLPPSWESKLPPEVGAMIVENMISLGPDQGDGVQGMESLVYESAIAKQRERDNTPRQTLHAPPDPLGFPDITHPRENSMDRASNSAYKPALATTPTNSTTPATPPLSNTGTVAMSIADLQRCSVPPLHETLYLDFGTNLDFRTIHALTLDWLSNGTRPQPDGEVDLIAAFCVKQKLPDALSWLMLQCGPDTLDFAGEYLDDQDAQMIASWLERCPRPIALDLASNDIGYEGAIALAGVLKNHAILTSLNLERNNFGDTGATALADALLTNSTLTSLNVAKCNISATGATFFAEALLSNSTLTSLNVEGSKFSDSGAIIFANALKTNSTLTSLSVVGNDIGDAGASALADALTTDSTLTSLDLALNGIGATGATDLANALETNSALTSLNLDANRIGATGATALANALKTNSALTSLNLSGNEIRASGATALADALKTNLTLASLNVSRNDIDATGATALAKVLKANSTLTSLDASHNDIGATGPLAFADTLETNLTLTALELRERRSNATVKSARAIVEFRINANKRSKPLADPAVESLVMLASSQNSYFPSEVGKLIVQNMITLDFYQGNGPEGLESLVVASSIVQKRELATEAFQTLPTSWESKLPPEVGAMIVENMISLGPDQGDGVQGMESLVYESAIAKQREREKKG